MTPIDQKYLRGGDIPGDCVRACVCSILDLPLEEVPHFVRWHGHEWAVALMDWCEARGIEANCYSGGSDHNAPYMLCGPSPREGRHAVVAQAGLIIHDPHPSRAGLLMQRRSDKQPFYFNHWIFTR